jgi:hypothetical protein
MLGSPSAGRPKGVDEGGDTSGLNDQGEGQFPSPVLPAFPGRVCGGVAGDAGEWLTCQPGAGLPVIPRQPVLRGMPIPRTAPPLRVGLPNLKITRRARRRLPAP